MFRQAYQRGVLSIFYSIGPKPLAIWDTFTRDGYIKRFLDEDIKSSILEIGGTNVSTTYMVCPKGKAVLGIAMPFLVMVVKNLKKYFSFEVTILDDTGTRRRFRISNFQSTTQVLPLCTVMPLGLSDGWNQIQFNLAEFTRRAYKKQFVEVQKVKINANIRLRRIYFADGLIPEAQLPAEFRLFYPLRRKPLGNIDKKTSTEIKQEKEDKIITPPIGIDREQQEQERENKIITPQQQEGRVSSVAKSKGSMQVIKAVSVVEALDEKSRILEVPEENVDPAADTIDDSNVNMDPDPLLQVENATTQLIKEAEGITTETASTATEFLKTPSLGTELGTTEDKKEKSANMIAGPVDGAINESVSHAGTTTPIEGMV